MNKTTHLAASGLPSNIALLADYENVAGPLHAFGESMLRHLRGRGRILVRRAYADWSEIPEKAQRSLAASGFELVALTTYRRNGKNAADIRLVVDAMAIAASSHWIDSFVLVTGDSDYVPLIVRLREMGRRVTVVSDQRHLDRAAISAFCDELIPFSRWEGEDLEAPTPVDAFTPIIDCIEAIFQGAPTLASGLKPAMVQLDPAFDEACYGYRRFSDYLRAAEQSGVVRLTVKDSAIFVTPTPRPDTA